MDDFITKQEQYMIRFDNPSQLTPS